MITDRAQSGTLSAAYGWQWISRRSLFQPCYAILCSLPLTAIFDCQWGIHTRSACHAPVLYGGMSYRDSSAPNHLAHFHFPIWPEDRLEADEASSKRACVPPRLYLETLSLAPGGRLSADTRMPHWLHVGCLVCYHSLALTSFYFLFSAWQLF